MKKSGRCPKCESTRIHRSPWKRLMRGRNQIPLTFFRAASIEMLVCVDCGYLEQYFNDPEHRALAAEKWPKAR